MMPFITVFTPTYNRSHCLRQCYESLKHQTSKDFLWLIIDDGSNDGTGKLAEEWIKENAISIKYLYQENKGMHGAHNTAYSIIDTELNICVDSDDYLVNDAIKEIASFWNKFKSDDYAGIIALDADKSNKIIGTRLPEGIKDSKYTELYQLKGVKGDKKLIYRTDIMKRLPPYPEFKGEKYFALSYKYMLADQNYKLLLMNKAVCIVDYSPDGSSRNMLQQYRNNPRGFAFMRKFSMQHSLTSGRCFIECIHYVSSSLISGNSRFLEESPRKLFSILAFPFGIILYLFIKYFGKQIINKGE